MLPEVQVRERERERESSRDDSLTIALRSGRAKTLLQLPIAIRLMGVGHLRDIEALACPDLQTSSSKLTASWSARMTD